jgi:Bacterial transferase hexapeptide (six repeats)
MKTLIVIKEAEFDWLRTSFPDRPPLMAPVCNKPLLEYLLDFAILCGSRHVRLATDMPLAAVEAVFGDGGRWGVDLTYAPIRKTDDLDAIRLKNSRYCAGSRLLWMQGCFFLHYDKQTDYGPFMQTAAPGELLTGTTGRILIQDDTHRPGSTTDVPPPPLALTPLRSVSDLHRRSLRVLGRDAGRYVLPGYNNEKDVFIGRNVMIARSARIVPPVMIGNHVQIHKNAVVGPNAVIGDNVIIDAHSRVRHSVVLDNTYVGEHLVLDRKLAGGHRLVDPGEETMVQMEDAHLLSTMQPFSRGRNRFHRLGHGALAALLWALLAIPFAVLSFVLKRQGRWRRTEETFWVDNNGRSTRLARVSLNRSGFWGRIAASLALDRYPLLGRVIGGNLALIGTRLLPATDANRATIESDTGYRPGLFSYAEGESWPVPAPDQDIVNRFHLAHRTFFYDVVMVVKVLLNKLHGATTP